MQNNIWIGESIMDNFFNAPAFSSYFRKKIINSMKIGQQ